MMLLLFMALEPQILTKKSLFAQPLMGHCMVFMVLMVFMDFLWIYRTGVSSNKFRWVRWSRNAFVIVSIADCICSFDNYHSKCINKVIQLFRCCCQSIFSSKVSIIILWRDVRFIIPFIFQTIRTQRNAFCIIYYCL